MKQKISTPFYVGLTLVGSILFIALLSPWLTVHDPTEMLLQDRLQPPSSLHIMGTDQNGVDVFSQVAFGARISLLVSFSVMLMSLFVGLLIGSLAGYLGGWVDTVLMALVDMIFAFPGFLLVLTMAAVFQSSSVATLIFILCLTGWASYARLIRGEVLHLKSAESALGAQALGASAFRKLVFYIWPSLTGPLVVQASFGMAVTVLTESSLSFLGLGVSPSTPTWGSLLNSGREYLLEAPYLSFFPGLMLLILVLGFNLLGDGLRDYLDPKAADT